MRAVAKIISWLALGATLVLPILFYLDQLSLDAMKTALLAAALAWFATSPFWLDRPASA